MNVEKCAPKNRYLNNIKRIKKEGKGRGERNERGEGEMKIEKKKRTRAMWSGKGGKKKRGWRKRCHGWGEGKRRGGSCTIKSGNTHTHTHVGGHVSWEKKPRVKEEW